VEFGLAASVFTLTRRDTTESAAILVTETRTETESVTEIETTTENESLNNKQIKSNMALMMADRPQPITTW